MYFLYSNIIPIKGYCRSILYDLQNSSFELIPNDLYFEFKKNKGLYQYTKSKGEYLDFLLEKEYLFIAAKNEIAYFPQIKKQWESPGFITNAVLYYSVLSEDLLNKLTFLRTKNIAIIIDTEINKVVTKKLIDVLNSDCMKSKSIQNISVFVFNNGANSNVQKQLADHPFIDKVEFVEDTIETYLLKNEIKLTPSNIDLFMEAGDYNLYYNKKLFIDKDGTMKNSYKSNISYGNIIHIKETELKQRVTSDTFTKIWKVSKRKTDVCSCCEFRYMCIDSRIPEKGMNNNWYNKSECSYNPYISKWKNEPGYKTLEECGVTSTKNGVKINKHKLNKINRELWGN